MLHQHENCEKQDLFDQKYDAAEVKPESHRRLHSRRPEKIVKLIAADVANREPEKSTIGLHPAERTLTKNRRSLIHHVIALADKRAIPGPRRLVRMISVTTSDALAGISVRVEFDDVPIRVSDKDSRHVPERERACDLDLLGGKEGPSVG